MTGSFDSVDLSADNPGPGDPGRGQSFSKGRQLFGVLGPGFQPVVEYSASIRLPRIRYRWSRASYEEGSSAAQRRPGEKGPPFQ